MVEARSLEDRYQTELWAGSRRIVVDTRKDGLGGSGGVRPHELLEAALASCLAISARMAVDEPGIHGVGAIARVSLKRSPSASTFTHEVSLDPKLTADQHRRVLARIEQSPVRRTLDNAIGFTAHGHS